MPIFTECSREERGRLLRKRLVSGILGLHVNSQAPAKNNDGEKAASTQTPPKNGELLGKAVLDRAVCHQQSSPLLIVAICGLDEHIRANTNEANSLFLPGSNRIGIFPVTSLMHGLGGARRTLSQQGGSIEEQMLSLSQFMQDAVRLLFQNAPGFAYWLGRFYIPRIRGPIVNRLRLGLQ
jgi:hypothetical protein